MKMTKEEIGRRFEEITIWRSGDHRAPHKPLLLLYALAKCSRGEARLIPYRDIDPDLRAPPALAEHACEAPPNARTGVRLDEPRTPGPEGWNPKTG